MEHFYFLIHWFSNRLIIISAPHRLSELLSLNTMTLSQEHVGVVNVWLLCDVSLVVALVLFWWSFSLFLLNLLPPVPLLTLPVIHLDIFLRSIHQSWTARWLYVRKLCEAPCSVHSQKCYHADERRIWYSTAETSRQEDNKSVVVSVDLNDLKNIIRTVVKDVFSEQLGCK